MSETMRAGRPRGSIDKGALPARVMALPKGGMVLVPDDGAHVRQNCARAVAKVNEAMPEAVYSVVLCNGAPVRDASDEFNFFRIRREA